MAAAQHKLSRRALLAGACAGAALPFSRYAGLDPESTFLAAVEKERWIPDQVRDDSKGRDDGRWRKALAHYARAGAGLEAVVHNADDDVYGRALGRHRAALARLLRAPAPNLRAVAWKLDLIVRHRVFELSFGEASMAALRRDVLRLHRG
ncbi:MAG: hypothetical protein QOG72_1363 [Sphingomonadales bacterium]|jgi:hypothetical protein|nr:hypothetical protein [Sphingomonadales bacterium]